MPTEKTISLPFESTLTSFSGWLAGLPTNERERYTVLYSGLEALNAAETKPQFHFSALEKIRGLIFQASDNLASPCLGKPFPLEFGIRKLIKLSAQFHDELARGYYSLIEAKGFARNFSEAERGQIIHNAFRAHNQMLLRLALMYEAPSSSTWQRLNMVYRQAEQAGLARHSEEEYPGLANPEACTVEELYLRMLAFRLASPYFLEQRDIQEVFDLLRQNVGLMALGRDPVVEGRRADFAVDLDSPAMPTSLSGGAGVAGGGDWRYLSVAPLRKMFAALGVAPVGEGGWVFSPKALGHLHVRLGGSFEPLPEKDKKSLRSVVVVGYKNLIDMLSTSRRGGDASAGGFKLQSLDEYVLPTSRIESSKSSGTFSAPPPAAGQMPGKLLGQGVDAAGLPCSVSPTGIPAVYNLRSPGLQWQAGRLLGVFIDNKLNQFGILCPGRNEKSPDDYGFERLADQVSMVKVSFDANPKKTYSCFFSDLGYGRYSLISEPLRLRGGDGMSVSGYQGLGLMKRYRVAKLLEKTPEFCQFEVVVEPSR